MKQFLFLLLAALLLPAIFCSGCRGFEKSTVPEKKEKEFSETAITLLDDKEEIFVNTDGTYTVIDFCVYKVNNYDGVLQMRTIPLHFNSDYGTMAVTDLVLIKSDGRRLPLDPEKNSSVSVDNSQMNSEIFDPAQKILSVRIPGLEINDTIEITTLEKITKPRIPGEFSDIAVLQADFPIKHYEYIINMPEGKPLHSICIKDEVKGTLKFDREEKAGRIIYRWTAENVPHAIPENHMPPMYTCVQRILTSTVKSWEDISKWYDKLCAPHLAAIDDAMLRKTEELTSNSKNDMEKITALFQFVSQQIRYTGITDEESAPGYEPHDVSKTFYQRHGVCRDKAALLTAMLKLAGFKAYPVLFMSGSSKDPEVPNIYFNHAIVGVETYPGTYMLMDPTFETTTELLPGYLAGYPFLVAKPDGETLRTAPPTAAENNLLEINTRALLRNNTLSVTLQLDFNGIYDQMFRAAFSEWTNDNVKNYFAAAVRKISPGAVVQNIVISPENIRDMSKKLTVKLSFEVSNMLDLSAAVQPLAVPRGAFVFGMLDSLYSATALKNRRFPLETMPRAVREKITFSFNDDEQPTVILPENIEISEAGLFRVKSGTTAIADGFTEEYFFAIDSMLVVPKDYGKLKNAAAKAGNLRKIFPLIRRKQKYSAENANAEIIDESRHYYINNQNSWDETTHIVMNIRNYAGLKEYANMTIPFVDNVEKLDISATVTNSKGEKFTLSPKDINYMDSPATAAAPRYLKRKLAVISFPGVDVGSTIDCTIRKTTSGHPFFYTQLTSAGSLPVRKKELIIEHPAQMTLKISAIPDDIQDSATFGGRRIIRRYTMENVPAVPIEPDQPPLDLFVPALFISSGDNEILFNRINYAATIRAQEVTPEIKALAEKIAAEAPDLPIPDGITVPDKNWRTISIIYALEKYIYQHIRLADIPLNQLRETEFSSPQTILTDAYGSDTDRAILLASMLHALDIEFSFLPVYTFPSIEKKLRQLKDFPQNCYNKLLIRTVYDILLNDSGLYAEPGNIHNGESISLDSGCPEHIFHVLPSGGTEIKCSIRVNKDFSASIQLKYNFQGTDLEQTRELFARMTSAQADQYIQKLAVAVSPQSKIEYWQYCSAADKDNLILDLNVPDFVKRTGKFLFFELPEYRRMTSRTAHLSKKRETPYLPNIYRTDNIKYYIELPEGGKFLEKHFEDKMSSAGGIQYFNIIDTQDNILSIENQITTLPDIYFPEDVDLMLDLINTVNHINSKTILFTTESNL